MTQSFYLAYVGLTFPATPQINAASAAVNSADISCSKRSRVVVKVTYSANNVSAPIIILMKDSTGLYTPSDQIIPANLGIQEGSRYMAATILLETLGSEAFQVRLHGTPTNSGDVTVYATAI